NSGCSESSKNSVSSNSKVLKFLRGWALKHNITHEATSDLLKGLKENYECFADESESRFPISAKTLLKTEVKLTKKVVEPGCYIHIGLQKHLLKIAPKYFKTVGISNLLVRFQRYIPKEFARKSRELYIVLRWKATEFRLFILYLGPVVLKNVLSEEKYVHFLQFHFAMRILLNVKFCKEQEFRKFAKDLLKHFVQSTIILYDKNFISHNFHNNIHITDDVDYFVDKLDDFSLDTISAFRFENYMQSIKRKVRGRSKPLEQIGLRIGEIMSFETDYLTEKQRDNQFPKLSLPHNSGPLLPGCTRQYRGVALPNFKVINESPNNCCGNTSGSIIQIENIAFSEYLQIPVVIGREFIDKRDFYTVPSEISRVGVFKVKKLSNLKIWPLSEITIKYVKLPYKNDYVVLSILHCDTL
ncbi:hypothetical protein ALC57_09336, partial [Trachymyrmex cornetzi]